MVKENIEKTVEKAINKATKEFNASLKEINKEIKKVTKDLKTLTQRLDRFENPKPTKPPKKVKEVSQAA